MKNIHSTPALPEESEISTIGGAVFARFFAMMTRKWQPKEKIKAKIFSCAILIIGQQAKKSNLLTIKIQGIPFTQKDFFAIIKNSRAFFSEGPAIYYFHKRTEKLKEEFIMAYIINDSCISCGACEPECPVSAITAGDTQYVIDAASCIDCGACSGVCPVDAPQPE